MGITTKRFGSVGGGAFPAEFVKEIGVRGGARVDAINLNGTWHGGPGGGGRSIVLADDEYVSKVYVRQGSWLDYIEFTTNLGNTVRGGNLNGGAPTKLEDIRLLNVSGYSGLYLDNVELTWVEDYKPSQIEHEDIGVVFSYVAPYTKMSEYSQERMKNTEAYKYISEFMVNTKVTASVEGEYYAKYAASTAITVQQINTEEMAKEAEKELEQGTAKEQEVPAGHVGVFVGRCNILTLTTSDLTEYWMELSSSTSYTLVKKSDGDTFRGFIDLTGNLYTQLPALKDDRTTRWGYTYYSADA